MKRTRLRRQSTARRVEQAIRRAIVDEIGPQPCALRILNLCTGPADALHELVGAAQGGSRIDRRNLAPACNRCNSWVEDFPSIAYARRMKVPACDAVSGDHGLVPARLNPHAIVNGGWDG